MLAGDYGEGTSEKDRVAFAMELRPGNGVMVTDADQSPWRDAKQWWAVREQRRRTKHLKVVKRDGSSGDRPRWMN